MKRSIHDPWSLPGNSTMKAPFMYDEFEAWWNRIYKHSGGGPSPNGKFTVIKDSIRNAFIEGYLSGCDKGKLININDEKYNRLVTPIDTVYIEHRQNSQHTLTYSLVTKQQFRIKCNGCGEMSRHLSDEEVECWKNLGGKGGLNTSPTKQN